MRGRGEAARKTRAVSRGLLNWLGLTLEPRLLQQ